jgi:hypothetical protein
MLNLKEKSGNQYPLKSLDKSYQIKHNSLSLFDGA